MRNFKNIISVTAVLMAVFSLPSCYEEPPLTPSALRDDLLFEFPQDNKEHDRAIQNIQEEFGTYVIYKDITDNLLNRAWINLYPTMTLTSSPLAEGHVPYYVDFLQAHLFDYFKGADVINESLPKYFFIVNNMHREENGVAKPHLFTMTEGVDFWALSFKVSEAGVIQAFDSKLARIKLAYALIKAAYEEGKIEVPASFYQGIDYKNPVYNAIYNDGSVHEWHYQLRGFVKYVQPTFEYESPATNISVIGMAGEDFLMYVRKILFTSPAAFLSENSRWEKVMERYRIILDMFESYGVDLSAISEGPDNR